MVLEIASPECREAIANGFLNDLASYTHHDNVTNQLVSVVCSVCDMTPTKPHWASWIPVVDFRKQCLATQLQKHHFLEYYPEKLLNDYGANHPLLHNFLLSPVTRFTHHNNQDCVLVCNDCLSQLPDPKENMRGKKHLPPRNAIANGYAIGAVPVELSVLNPVELSLVSRVHIYSRTWIFYAGCHQQIRGWHTFFRNRHEHHVGNINVLAESGMKGHVLVILIGPFTAAQVAKVKEAVCVRNQLVQDAILWNIENNYHYRNDVVLAPDALPVPIIIDDEWYVFFVAKELFCLFERFLIFCLQYYC